MNTYPNAPIESYPSGADGRIKIPCTPCNTYSPVSSPFRLGCNVYQIFPFMNRYIQETWVHFEMVDYYEKDRFYYNNAYFEYCGALAGTRDEIFDETPGEDWTCAGVTWWNDDEYDLNPNCYIQKPDPLGPPVLIAEAPVLYLDAPWGSQQLIYDNPYAQGETIVMNPSYWGVDERYLDLYHMALWTRLDCIHIYAIWKHNDILTGFVPNMTNNVALCFLVGVLGLVAKPPEGKS